MKKTSFHFQHIFCSVERKGVCLECAKSENASKYKTRHSVLSYLFDSNFWLLFGVTTIQDYDCNTVPDNNFTYLVQFDPEKPKAINTFVLQHRNTIFTRD